MTHAQKQVVNELSGNERLEKQLERIADALENTYLSPKEKMPSWDDSVCFVWNAESHDIKPITNIKTLPLKYLIGLDHQAQTLIENTQQFADGFPANNALLWGARGTGKSALIKAVHQEIAKAKNDLKLVEVHREDLGSLQNLLDILGQSETRRFLLFCDDLSFDENETSYKSLKTVLEGGIAGRPDNVLFYATSNRRHLMPRDMIENERSTAIHPSEATEEKVSLSDRFGLWLGFYPYDQNEYLAIIDSYLKVLDINDNKETVHKDALEWAKTRGNRSGRVAWQFMQDLAGKHKKNVVFLEAFNAK